MVKCYRRIYITTQVEHSSNLTPQGQVIIICFIFLYFLVSNFILLKFTILTITEAELSIEHTPIPQNFTQSLVIVICSKKKFTHFTPNKLQFKCHSGCLMKNLLLKETEEQKIITRDLQASHI